jgi:membrane protein
VGTSFAELIDRVRQFFVTELWREDFGGQGIAGGLLRGLQLGALIGRGFVNDRLLLSASALTYMTSLALIPILVVVLSIIQWLGLSRDLVILGVNQFLAGSPGAVDRIMDFVDGAEVGALGSAGGAVFLLTTILSARHVEETFNGVWGVLQGRGWVRRFTNYLAVLVVVPLVLGVLVSLTSTPGAEAVVGHEVVDSVRWIALGVGPAVFLFVVFSLAYLLLPNTRVRLVSAMLGGGIAAGLFIAAQRLYVAFSIGAARYDALFGGFAFVPLMLVWIYVSWGIVLLGVEISHAHQTLARYRREARDRTMEPAEREAVGMRVAVEVARTFRDEWPPQTAERLADRLGSSLRVVTELLLRFEKAGIVSVCGDPDGDCAYQLGRPAESIEVDTVLAAIRGERSQAPAARGGDTAVRNTMQRVDRLLAEAQGALGEVGRHTLSDLLVDLPGIEMSR